MSDDNTEWEEWTMNVSFTFTFTSEGPFPVDMPDDERAEKVKQQFEDSWSNEFYQACVAARRHQLDVSDPEKYEL
jgi:hypothetical protein